MKLLGLSVLYNTMKTDDDIFYQCDFSDREDGVMLVDILLSLNASKLSRGNRKKKTRLVWLDCK